MKSYLVIETPKTCGGCPCMNMRGGYVCQEEWRDVENPDHVPMWCPLKPLPDKKPVSYHDDLFGDVEKNFTNIGWNACIEELEK